MQPKDIADLTTLGVPTLSPDGRLAVVAATRADLGVDAYRSRLWIAPVDGSEPARPITGGPRDSAPRFSLDGHWLAFLRAEDDKPPQLFLLPVHGGEARRLTDLPLGAGEPVWSPDSRAIAFTARCPEPGRYGQDDDVPAGKEPPRRITGLQYRLDGTGFLVDRPSHVHVVDITADAEGQPQPEQLTDGAVDDTDVAWSPDGAMLAFLSARHDRREHDRFVDAFVMATDGSGLRRVTDTSVSLSGVTWSADGSSLLGVGSAGTAQDYIVRNSGLWRIAVSAQPEPPVRLTDAESVHIHDAWIVAHDRGAVVAVENRGAQDLVKVDDTGVTVRSAGHVQILGADVAGDVVVVTYTDASTSGELARLEGGELEPLTHFAATSGPALTAVGELTATAPDGYPVHGFLTVPEGPGPHPVLLMIHGGPFAQYGWGAFDEAQVYSGAGYAVVYGNPRGSSGYGESHGRYILGDVGERQAPDLLALLEVALERSDLDSTRVGVLGGSHGGFMTSWLIGHTDRFRAAVSERAVNAVDSFEGSSDIGWDFADHLYGKDPEARRRQSPLTYADAITTPLLIVHSEHDWRCPIEQAQRLYVALRKRDAEVEMLLFPGEGHELSRSGTPKHRVARFEAIIEWFDRFLSPSRWSAAA